MSTINPTTRIHALTEYKKQIKDKKQSAVKTIMDNGAIKVEISDEARKLNTELRSAPVVGKILTFKRHGNSLVPEGHSIMLAMKLGFSPSAISYEQLGKLSQRAQELGYSLEIK